MKEVKGLLFFNMKNSLSAADSFFLYGERYDEFCKARETINKVYRFEELLRRLIMICLKRIFWIERDT